MQISHKESERSAESFQSHAAAGVSINIQSKKKETETNINWRYDKQRPKSEDVFKEERREVRNGHHGEETSAVTAPLTGAAHLVQGGSRSESRSKWSEKQRKTKTEAGVWWLLPIILPSTSFDGGKPRPRFGTIESSCDWTREPPSCRDRTSSLRRVTSSWMVSISCCRCCLATEVGFILRWRTWVFSGS